MKPIIFGGSKTGSLMRSPQPAPPHPFMQKLHTTLGAAQDDYVTLILRHQRKFQASLIESRRNPLSRAAIPEITHRVWLTSAEAPTFPPKEYVSNYLNNSKALPSETLHYFWTNSPIVATALREQATTTGCANVCTMSTELFGREAGMSRIERLIEARKFVLAADMLKFFILERFGGVHSDLGILYDKQLFELILLLGLRLHRQPSSVLPDQLLRVHPTLGSCFYLSRRDERSGGI